MAAAAAGGDDGEKSGCRWVDAARYAVAALVTLLIAVVIVKAIKVVLRSEPLQLWVAGGSVSAVAIPQPAEAAVSLGLSIWAQNPSDRARMYFLNITGYLFDKNTSASTSDPGFDSMIVIPAKDIVAVQLEAVESALQVTAKKGGMTPESFGLLYNGGSMSDVTLRLDGNLITEVTSELNKTRRATYYCEQLLVGGDANDKSVKDKQTKAICKQRQGP
ncbi:unnamed protein product [Urochloa humidicola]